MYIFISEPWLRILCCSVAGVRDICTFVYISSVLNCWLLKCMKQCTLKLGNRMDSKKARWYVCMWNKRTNLCQSLLCISRITVKFVHERNLCRVFALLIVYFIAFLYQNWYVKHCNMSLSTSLRGIGSVIAEALVRCSGMPGFSPRVFCLGCCVECDT
jgi:hypothetical protein